MREGNEHGMSQHMCLETGFVDVGEWQAAFDLKTGRALKGLPAGHEALPETMRRFPFPGDLSPRSASWVTDVALEMDRLYSPTLMVLIQAGLSFKTMYGGSVSFDAELENVCREIERFGASSGLGCIILGLGNLVPVEGFVDLSELDGLGLGSGFPSPYAGIYRPSEQDIACLEGLHGVARVSSREEFRARFGGSGLFYARFPDYLLELEEGYVVKGFGIPAREPCSMPRKDASLPLATIGEPQPLAVAGEPPPLDSITDLKGCLGRDAPGGRRMALILVEGLGTDGFPWRHQEVGNTMGWFRYTLGDAQYLAVSSGRHMTEHGHPPCLRYYAEDDSYPYSGIFNELPSALIGQGVEGLSVAVGNRSIYTHACLGADITVECFARTLYNYGTLAVLRNTGKTRATRGR